MPPRLPPAPAGTDPCAGQPAPCESAAVGPLVLFSTKAGKTITTVATHEDGSVFRFQWTRVSRDTTALVITFPNEAPSEPVRLATPLPKLWSANIAAAAFVGLGPSSGVEPLTTAVPSTNHAGCD